MSTRENMERAKTHPRVAEAGKANFADPLNRAKAAATLRKKSSYGMTQKKAQKAIVKARGLAIKKGLAGYVSFVEQLASIVEQGPKLLDDMGRRIKDESGNEIGGAIDPWFWKACGTELALQVVGPPKQTIDVNRTETLHVEQNITFALENIESINAHARRLVENEAGRPETSESAARDQAVGEDADRPRRVPADVRGESVDVPAHGD